MSHDDKISQYAELLNTLDEMAKSYQYALRKDVLRQAEKVIVEQERRIAALERDRDMYRTMFNHALDCVDRVFQVDSTKPAPLLPNFLGLGEDKFKGVIKLAEEYLRLKGPTP